MKQVLHHLLFLNVDKAFDKIWFNSLRLKLQKLKIPDMLIRWISSFIRNRSMSIQIKDLIYFIKPTYCLPQGSPLSPILFINTIRYASDLTLFTRLLPPTSINPEISVSSTPKVQGTSHATSLESIASTPSSKRKRVSNADKNSCRKCHTTHGSRTDNEYNSFWICCAQSRCDYWVHTFCLVIIIIEKDEEKCTNDLIYMP